MDELCGSAFWTAFKKKLLHTHTAHLEILNQAKGGRGGEGRNRKDLSNQNYSLEDSGTFLTY